MKALQRLIAEAQGDELITEINDSKNATFFRGVKRLCLEQQGPVGNGSDPANDRVRSFLETRWELEVRTRRRKRYLDLFKLICNRRLTFYVALKANDHQMPHKRSP